MPCSVMLSHAGRKGFGLRWRSNNRAMRLREDGVMQSGICSERLPQFRFRIFAVHRSSYGMLASATMPAIAASYMIQPMTGLDIPDLLDGISQRNIFIMNPRSSVSPISAASSFQLKRDANRFMFGISRFAGPQPDRMAFCEELLYTT
jgi:hypothetical protein